MTRSERPKMTIARSEIVYYAEPLGHGRGIMRCDVVWQGELISSELDGSPAPLATVQAHERRVSIG